MCVCVCDFEAVLMENNTTSVKEANIYIYESNHHKNCKITISYLAACVCVCVCVSPFLFVFLLPNCMILFILTN